MKLNSLYFLNTIENNNAIAIPTSYVLLLLTNKTYLRKTGFKKKKMVSR